MSRKDALKHGEKRYHGRQCMHCGGTERFSSNGGCVRCVKRSAPRTARIAAGIRTYIGQACNKCGNPIRYIDGQCVKCVAQQSLRWREANRSRHLESARTRAAAWRKANPDKARAIWLKSYRKRRAENPDQFREWDRKWRAANPDKHHEIRNKAAARYRASNKEKLRDLNARRRSRGKTTTAKWLKASGQYEAIRILYVDARRSGMHVDHDIPLSGCRVCGAIGLHVLANLRLLDRFTNQRKSSKCGACT